MITKVIILIVVLGVLAISGSTLYICACEHIWIFDPDFYSKEVRRYERDIEELREEIRELKDQMNDTGFFNKED